MHSFVLFTHASTRAKGLKRKIFLPCAHTSNRLRHFNIRSIPPSTHQGSVKDLSKAKLWDYSGQTPQKRAKLRVKVQHHHEKWELCLVCQHPFHLSKCHNFICCVQFQKPHSSQNESPHNALQKELLSVKDHLKCPNVVCFAIMAAQKRAQSFSNIIIFLCEPSCNLRISKFLGDHAPKPMCPPPPPPPPASNVNETPARGHCVCFVVVANIAWILLFCEGKVYRI